MDIYKPPESDLEIDACGAPPKLAYILMALFLFESFSVIAINLLGSYDIEAAHLFSLEMAIVFAASIFLLVFLWSIIKQGSKSISHIIYIFLAISIFFDGSNWVSKGIFIGISEALTFINFIVLLSALYLVKSPLKGWFIR